MLLGDLLHLEPRLAHLDTQCLHFIGTRHSTAVIVGEHDDGHTFQAGVEHTLAGDVEVIAINKSNGHSTPLR